MSHEGSQLRPHFNQSLESHKMHLPCYLKWPSILGLNRGICVCPIVEDIFLSHIDSLLEELYNQRGEQKGFHREGCITKISQ
jgi:hypothetical protein